MATTRSKSSSSKHDSNPLNSDSEPTLSTITIVKELLAVHESALKTLFTSFIDSNNKRFDSLIGEVQALKNSLEFTQKDVQGLKQHNLDVQINDIQKEVDMVKDKLDDLENRSRRNNLCFDGIEESLNESWRETEAKVKELLANQLNLENDMVIERAHRVGAKKEGKNRPIVCKFLNYKDRDNIFNEKKLLKGTGVFIRDDVSERVLNKRKELMPKLIEARNNGKIAYFQFDKLVIREKRFHRGGFDGYVTNRVPYSSVVAGTYHNQFADPAQLHETPGNEEETNQDAGGGE